MIFNSLSYLLFLAIIVALYWRLQDKGRLCLLFTSGLIFYGFWRVEFIPLILFQAGVDYYASIKMPGSSPKVKKAILFTAIFINISVLFYFKYLIFFAQNAVGLVNLLGGDLDPISLKIILPLGISFYTFHTISYTVDVYRGHIKPVRKFMVYGSFVTFFPLLVAGPIIRAGDTIEQLIERPPFDASDILIGIKRIIFGLFLKVVLADNIAPLIDSGFAMPIKAMSAFDVFTLAFLFGFQIYFDFSGYSHIALGSARLMGITIPENFNFPYIASSPKDFWNRWHISLSTWVRDYIYLPLIGTRPSNGSASGNVLDPHKRSRTYALFATWSIMGIWHGASWTFLIWGLYHASAIYVHRVFSSMAPPTEGSRQNGSMVSVILTLPIMMLGWIPFRAESLNLTFAMWSKIFNPYAYTFLGMRENVYLITAVLTLGMFATYWGSQRKKLDTAISFITESFALSIAIPLVIIFLRPISQFIYFQF